MKRIRTEEAPLPIGAYSQAVEAGGFLFVSGQIPIDPSDGNLVEGDAAAQAERALSNLEAILKASGGSLASVVKVTVFLVDLAWFTAVNEVFTVYFGDNPPAREVVEVSRLPKDAGIEISATAWVGEG
ncbi:MAG: Rid family detoxifying hydrolase [Candidatus Aquicultorales bacterium]